MEFEQTPGGWWRTEKPGMLQSMGSQSQTQLSDWKEQQQTPITGSLSSLQSTLPLNASVWWHRILRRKWRDGARFGGIPPPWRPYPEILRDSHQACQGQNFRFVTAKSAFSPLLQQGHGGVFPGVELSLRGHCIQGRLSWTIHPGVKLWGTQGIGWGGSHLASPVSATLYICQMLQFTCLLNPASLELLGFLGWQIFIFERHPECATPVSKALSSWATTLPCLVLFSPFTEWESCLGCLLTSLLAPWACSGSLQWPSFLELLVPCIWHKHPPGSHALCVIAPWCCR